MKKVFKILTNKFVLTIIAFGAVMLFFDQNNYFVQKRRKQELKETNKSIQILNEESERMQSEINALEKDSAFIEKVARERFHYKKSDEDVFLIIRDTPSKQPQ